MYALNFYSPMVADQLRSGRKSATIRLGDKSSKYKKGMVVQVLCGVRFGTRERVFEAVIDKDPALVGTFLEGVEVKSPESLRPEHFVVITIRTSGAAEVMAQLEGAGYRRGQDFVIWPRWKDAVRIR